MINRISFIYITSAELSTTYNPLTIAANILKKSGIDICFVGVNSNNNLTNYTPIGYSVYTVFHIVDTVSILCVSYMDGTIYTNTRTRTDQQFRGWKHFTV